MWDTTNIIWYPMTINHLELSYAKQEPHLAVTIVKDYMKTMYNLYVQC
jgi:hypothetical protein